VIHTTLYNMEIAAFLKGYQKALVYEAGPCSLCKKCPAEELNHLTLSDKKLCKHPKEARPAMEAAGIDVYSTVRRAGLEIHVVRDRSELFKVFGLLLLE
jgi:predicted metal-binding protein